jgi:hypothetical protein
MLRNTPVSILLLQEERSVLLEKADKYKALLGNNFKMRLRLGKGYRDELNLHIRGLRKDIKRIDTKLILLRQSVS